MTRIAVAVVSLFASVALAQTPTSDTTPGTMKAKPGTTMDDKGMGAKSTGMGWTPRKVTHEDKKGIEAMLTKIDNAWKTGDVAATAAMVDFPVYMVTDDSKGTVYTESWTKDMYMTNMTQAMKGMPDMKDMKVKHNRKYDFLTDDMAMVYDNASMTMGKQTINTRSASLVIQKDGKWMIKSMMEGGWGDSMKAKTETKG
jgi:hypothetical protein